MKALHALAAASLALFAPSNAAEVVFRGATAFPERDLRAAIADAIEEIETSGLNAADADDAAFFLGLHYRSRGYPDATVEPRLPGGDRLVLEVSEGTPKELGEVSVRGAGSIPEATLRDFIVGPTRERFTAFRSRRDLPFIATDIENGVANLRGHLEAEGHAHAVVHPPVFAPRPETASVDVTVSVELGPRFFFGEPAFAPPPETATARLLRQRLAPFSSQPFSPVPLGAMEREVADFYRERGHFDARVVVAARDPARAAAGRVPLLFAVDPGPVYTFRGLEVSGLDRLRESFVRHRFAPLEGRTYDPRCIDAVFRELMRTGVLRRLQIEREPRPDRTVRLKVALEENKARELGFYAGFGTYEGILAGITAADRDLFGSGRPLTANLEYSQQAIRGSLLYSDPWLFESRVAMRLRLYASTESWEGYSVGESGFRAEFSRELTRRWTIGLIGLSRLVNTRTDGISEEDLGHPHYLAHGVALTQTLDFRDNVLGPTRGPVITAALEPATAAGAQYLRANLRISHYVKLGRSLLALGARVGAIQGAGDQLPIAERFFNGGARSVRSYAERDLGPRDRGGYPIGGLATATLNAELEFPLWGELRGACFADAGAVADSAQALAGELRYGIGFGIRYRLPVGPLRVDAAWNPSPGPGDSFGAIHFGFGAAF